MIQSQIEKLKQLKELLDAGILTQEEMEAEKAKILGTDSSVPSKPTQTTEKPKVTPDNKPAEEKIIPLGHVPSSDSTNKKEPISTSTWWIIGVFVAIVLGFIIIASVATKTDHSSEYSYPPSTNDVDSVSSDTYDVDSVSHSDYDSQPTYYTTEESVESNEDYYIDPWSGTIVILGDVYRICSSAARLDLAKVSEGVYGGTIHMQLGDNGEWGVLDGNVNATLSGKTMTLSLIDCYHRSDEDDYFEGNDELKPGQKIFKITFDGTKYSAKALGNMDTYINNSMGIRVVK